MELRIRVMQEDDTYEVATTPWVIMLWERKFKTKASRISTEGLGLEDLAYLAYEGAKMSGRAVPINFDAFAKDIKSLEVIGDDATPTNAAASAG